MNYLDTINIYSLDPARADIKKYIKLMQGLLEKGSLNEAYEAYSMAKKIFELMIGTHANVVLDDEKTTAYDVYIWTKHKFIPEDAYDVMNGIIDANEIKKANNRNRKSLNKFLECKKMVEDAGSEYARAFREDCGKNSKKD